MMTFYKKQRLNIILPIGNNMTFSRKKKQHGYSLLELVVYMGILAMVVLAISSFAIFVNRVQIKTKVKRETMINAQLAYQTIEQVIRESQSVIEDESTLDINPSTITLQMYPDYPAATVIFGVDADKRLYYQEDSDPIVQLTSENVDIDNFFLSSYAGPNGIEAIDITIESSYDTTSTRPEFGGTTSFSGVVKLRNTTE